MPAAALTPDTLLHDMANLWLTLGQRGQIETGEGVLRACTLTLLVFAEETDDFQALGETLAALMPQHPARTIVVRIGAATPLAGRVFAQCWMPFGQRRQICCEQIEITAPGGSLSDALPLLDAIAAPDLPVIAWCRSLRLLDLPEFAKFLPVCNRVIVDTANALEPQPALLRLTGLAASGVHVGDLSWTRLTRWREMISQFFDNLERRARLRGTVRLRVEFGGTVPPTAARYLAVWLTDSLKSAGASVESSLEVASSTPAGELHRIELSAEGLRVEIRAAGGRLTITADELARCVSVPRATDYTLLREELGIMRSDPVFERTLRSVASPQ